jgi:hypothetical protein
LSTLVIEDLDNHSSRPILQFSDKKEEKIESCFARPGRVSEELSGYAVKCIFIDPAVNWIGEWKLGKFDRLFVH